MSSEIAVKVSHVGKTFHESQGAGSFKEAFVNVGRKFTGKKGKKIHKGEYTALKDIDFEIKKGEFFGIVGRNGCGKSTLLKIIAGVYAPSKGGVHVNGSLTPFIELGVGFNPELSGRDNVFLNGALLGFTRKQMEAMYDDIVEFAELKDFMDMKLKNYSSGMQVRLAFSVAIRADSDILLIDEVLAVGDSAFQNKCYEYFKNLKNNKKTVILVTHDMSAIEKYCNKAVLIEDGVIGALGYPDNVSKCYNKLFNTVVEKTKSKIKYANKSPRLGDESLLIKSPNIRLIKNLEKQFVQIQFNIIRSENFVVGDYLIAFALKDSASQRLVGLREKLYLNNKLPKISRWKFQFDNIFSRGNYEVDISIFSLNTGIYTDCWENCAKFHSNLDGEAGYPILINASLEKIKNDK